MTLYWDWIHSEAAVYGTDGCSHVGGFHVELCEEHDLAYRTGKDPRDAFRLAETFHSNIRAWAEAKPITRGEADARFRQGHQARSKFGALSPMALWRWLGVRLGGGKAWDEHRQREQAPAET